jgi:mannose-6-phosphate isomerase-like protein (cupin superfamily)
LSRTDRRAFLTSRERKGNWAQHVNDVWPGVHDGNQSLRILIGPDRLFGKYDLNNLRSKRLQITHSIYRPGGWTKRHVHPDHEQAYYIIRGRALVTVGEQTRVLGPGEVAFVPMGVEHRYSTYGGAPVELLDIHCYEDTPPAAPGSTRKLAPGKTPGTSAPSRPGKPTARAS